MTSAKGRYFITKSYPVLEKPHAKNYLRKKQKKGKK